MYFIFLFDLTPFLFGAVLILCALADQVAAALPVLCTLFWILFAIYAVFHVILLFIDEEHGVVKKCAIAIIMVISLYFIGNISQGFFLELEQSYGSGGFNGIFGFIVTVLFGGCTWLLALSSLTYASFGPMFAESNGKFAWNMILSVGILFLVNHFYL